MARLLADEHFDMRVVDNLRRRHGHDVLTIRQTCSSKYGDGIDDRAVIEQALADRRILLTDNRSDFRHLHAAMPWHSGIVLCPVYANASRKADLINDILRDTANLSGVPHFTGQLMTIPPEGSHP
jgi:hypothetical protein